MKICAVSSSNFKAFSLVNYRIWLNVKKQIFDYSFRNYDFSPSTKYFNLGVFGLIERNRLPFLNGLDIHFCDVHPFNKRNHCLRPLITTFLILHFIFLSMAIMIIILIVVDVFNSSCTHVSLHIQSNLFFFYEMCIGTKVSAWWIFISLRQLHRCWIQSNWHNIDVSVCMCRWPY